MTNIETMNLALDALENGLIYEDDGENISRYWDCERIDKAIAALRQAIGEAEQKGNDMAVLEGLMVLDRATQNNAEQAEQEPVAWRSHDTFSDMRVPEESEISGGMTDCVPPPPKAEQRSDSERMKPVSTTLQEPLATMLADSKKNFELQFGRSPVADWIYDDLEDVLFQAPPKAEQEPDDRCEECGMKYCECGEKDYD